MKWFEYPFSKPGLNMCENKECPLYRFCKEVYGDIPENSHQCLEILRDNGLLMELRVRLEEEFGIEDEIQICEVELR